MIKSKINKSFIFTFLFLMRESDKPPRDILSYINEFSARRTSN